MQNNLKGLLSREVLNMELYTQVQKKAEEHQKTAQLCIDFFQQTTRCFESFTNAIERPIQDCEVCNIS
jgi:aspartate carbamoyltransferase catalytic subunit